MIDNTYVKRRRFSSLYLGLILNIVIGIAVAVLVYIFLRLTANYVINTKYLSDEAKGDRLTGHITELQSYAKENKISSEDTDKIAYWAKRNPYVYLMVYKDDVLFFSSDMNDKEDDEPADGDGTGDGAEGSEGGSASGDKNDDYGGLGSIIGGNKIDIDKLIAEAEASGMHPIELEDGMIFAKIADYSEELYFNLANIASLVAGVIVFVVILIVYFRRILGRLKKLESDVNIVSHVNMNHKIVCKGSDEISMLSRNIENMRNSILDNLDKERAAREANTELVTAMSHDIRTPLTVLLGYIDMLKNYGGCDDTVKSYIGATEKTAMRLKDLSDDMFKYSLAFGSTDEQISLESYNAGMLMEQLFHEHILLLSESGYEVRVDRKSEQSLGEATVRTDPQNLMRIIDNIFQNINKYAKKDEPIDFYSAVERDRIRFVIRNKIDKDPSGAESNGIGLKTCKRLAQYIAEDFSYENDGEFFTVILSLKLEQNHNKHKVKK